MEQDDRLGQDQQIVASVQLGCFPACLYLGGQPHFWADSEGLESQVARHECTYRLCCVFSPDPVFHCSGVLPNSSAPGGANGKGSLGTAVAPAAQQLWLLLSAGSGSCAD